MRFIINIHSGVPIYKQLVGQIQNGILGNLLEAGQQMPTVRELALQLTVNPNTVARAYRELEGMGLLVSSQGRGTFVASGSIQEESSQQKIQIFCQSLEELLAEAKQLNISPDEVERIFLKALKEKKGDCHG